MQLVKKNILSILCGVVALIGVIAVFWPIGPMYEEANAALAQRAETYEKLNSLKTTTRKFPTMTLTDDEPPTLEYFPSQAVIAAGKAATKDLKDQSEQMLREAVRLNRRTPVYEAALPGGGGASAANITFRIRYLERLQQGLPNEVLNSGVPPTTEEILEAAEKLWRDEYTDRIVFLNDEEPEPVQLDILQQEYLEQVEKLPEQMRVERANSIKVYMEPVALAVSPELERPDPPPAAEDLWYAQVGLWLQEDVAKAVAALNAGEKVNVTNAPVKQIIAVDVEFGPNMYVTPDAGGTGFAGAEGEESAGTEGAEGGAAGAAAYGLSPTGRACNEIYDVVHFKTTLRVDARRIPQVLDELRRGKFITPIDVDVKTVDAAMALKEGYVYGEGVPVVDLDIQAEALFLREWTRKYMPKPVQSYLGLIKEGGEGEDGAEDGGDAARAPAAGPLPDALARRD